MNETPQGNPYVGPRSFEHDETLYGRDREIQLLLAQLISERMVLLHSPSGAGKTSLIQAGLVPLLQEENFHVLPVARVNLEPPAQFASFANFNRYTLSVLLSLEESLPADQRRSLEELASLTLDDYLSNRPRPTDAPRSDVLLFDQFEEILTINATDRDGKQFFFTQLGAALRSPNRWALFAMREDYIGAVAPYVRPIPNRLEATFRLDLLGFDAARQAIQNPARMAGVDFTDAAARKLADDLRRVQTQKPDGEYETVLGLYVEPVQLQVVCYRLWETRRPDDPDIDVDDIASVGDVDQSLADYYAVNVDKVAAKTGVNQRIIRDWFEQKLITKEGVRGQVLKGAAVSDGLDNRAIALLENAHIVRGEKRAGATWFELSHDRLIAPVRANNNAWFAANLILLQRQAALWIQQDRPEGLLLRGLELKGAEDEAKHLTLTEAEKDFLEACQKLRRAEERDRRRNRLMTVLAIGAMAALIVAIVFGVWAQNTALENAQLANEQATSIQNAELARATADAARLAAEASDSRARYQARQSRINEIGAQSQVALGQSLPRGLLLAVEAVNMNLNENEPVVPIAYQALRDGLERSVGTPLSGGSLPASTLAISPDDRWVAIGGEDGSIQLWDLKNPDNPPIFLAYGYAYDYKITYLRFSQDGHWLVSIKGEYYVNVRVWNLLDLTADPLIFPENTTSDAGAYAYNLNFYNLAISPDGRWLAMGYTTDYPIKTSQVEIWDMQDLKKDPIKLPFNDQLGGPPAFSPDGTELAFGTASGALYFWDPLKPNNAATVLSVGPGKIKELLYSSDGQRLAVYIEDAIAPNKISILGRKEGSESNATIRLGTNTISALLFSPDGQWLVTTLNEDCRYNEYGALDCKINGNLAIWSMFEIIDAPVQDFQNSLLDVTALTISGENKLAVGDSGGEIRIWDLGNIIAGPVIVPNAHRNGIPYLHFSSDNEILISDGNDGYVRIWNMHNLHSQSSFSLENSQPVMDVFLSPDKSRLVTWLAGANNWENDDSVRVVGVAQPQEPPIEIQFSNFSYYAFESVMISPLNSWLAANSSGANLILWNLNLPDAPYLALPVDASSYAFSPDERWITVYSAVESEVRAYDLSGGAKEFTLFKNEQGDNQIDGVNVLEYNTPGSLLFARNDEGLYVWKADQPDALPAFIPGNFPRFEISPDDQWLVTSNTDNVVQLRKIDQLENTPAILLGPSSESTSMLDFSPDGRWLIVKKLDQMMSLVDLQAPDPGAALLHPAQIPTPNITASAFSADSRWLAVANADKVIRVFDLLSASPEKVIASLQGHTLDITTLAFRPDGEWLASGSNDFSVRLWNLKTLSSNAVILRGHTESILFLDFTKDGSQLISASADRTIRFWSLSLETMVKGACDIAGRNLTRAEWALYFPNEDYRLTCAEWPEAADTNATPQAGAGSFTEALTATPITRPTPALVEIMLQYTIQPGDTLYGIALKFNTTLDAILKDNHISDPSVIVVGQTISIRAIVTATYGPSPTPTLTGTPPPPSTPTVTATPTP
jgi:WD40 repeat protein